MVGLLKQPREEQPMPVENTPPAPSGAPQASVPPSAPQTPPPNGAAVPVVGEEDVDENNPAFKKALEFALQALYEAGAADDIHRQLKKTKNKVETLASIAYEITSIVDERTEGQVPDELLVLLASNMLEEVVDIANASGLEVKPAEIAEAMKTMILRYVGEQGHDTQQLSAAMDAVNTEDVASAAEQLPDEEQTEVM